jgi:hypothetical protein
MSKTPMPEAAVANKKRKLARINIAKKALKNLGARVKFNSRTDIFKYLADVINDHEKLTNTGTAKGPCSRSGVYSIPEISIAVEKFWLTGVLQSDDVDLHETADAAAKKLIIDLELEVSNLKFDLAEKSRFLKDVDCANAKLKLYIESQDITGLPKALALEKESSKHPSVIEQEALIAKLYQIIFKLECWASGVLERRKDGALIDLSSDQVVISAQLMREYHERVSFDKVKE